MTAGQYQEDFNKHTAAGYRLANVSGYRGSGQDLYAAIWRKESGPGWVARHRMTSGNYRQEYQYASVPRLSPYGCQWLSSWE